MNKKEILIKAGKEYFYSGNDEFNTSRFAVCVNSLLQFVRKQTQILGAQEPEHIPDFSPRVLDKAKDVLGMLGKEKIDYSYLYVRIPKIFAFYKFSYNFYPFEVKI